jgi:hypothetical protein
MVCIPDRFAAEQELTLIQRKYGARFIKATIRKDRTTKNSTYTLRYNYQDAQTVSLF